MLPGCGGVLENLKDSSGYNIWREWPPPIPIPLCKIGLTIECPREKILFNRKIKVCTPHHRDLIGVARRTLNNSPTARRNLQQSYLSIPQNLRELGLYIFAAKLGRNFRSTCSIWNFAQFASLYWTFCVCGGATAAFDGNRAQENKVQHRALLISVLTSHIYIFIYSPFIVTFSQIF